MTIGTVAGSIRIPSRALEAAGWRERNALENAMRAEVQADGGHLVAKLYTEDEYGERFVAVDLTDGRWI